MNTYSSYKDSGIEWIGEIPSGWRIEKLKYIGNLYGGLTGKSGKDFNNEDNPYNKPFIPFTNIFNNVYISSNHFQYVNIKPDERQNRVIKNDLFFLMSSEGYEDLGKSSILISEIDELYLNSFCKGYRVNTDDVNPLFVNYQLLGNTHRKLISIEGKGFTRINLRQDKLKNTYMFIPPLQEQQQIVDYLDKKTSKIDKLIEKTEQKIELLKEQRTSLINTTVTKGLNPNVEMKDSGVEWIGEIPSKWKTTRLKYIFKLREEKTDTGEGELLTVTITKGIVRRRDFIKKGDHLSRSKSLKGYKVCYTNDLVNNIMKMGFRCLGISDYNGIVSPAYSVFSFINNKNKPMYWDYLLRTDLYVTEYKKRSKGIQESRMRLYDDYFLDIVSIVPPHQEQQQIVDYLDKENSKLDKLIDIESKRIKLLKEYRQSLISDVVTGKVDVRDEVLG